jgi:hypothetical protein
MLTWGYGPRPDFTDQIEPFAKSGFEFFVCPGVNGWSRILPDFDAATTNIRNFLRDGVAQGALGTINTTWDDDGENLGGAHWHGFAWGAECAWNGGTTTPEDFNRRVGAVVFGEAGDHFGQAVTLLGKACNLPGLDGMMNRRFWELDTAECPVSEPVARTQAAAILALVCPAMAHLQALRAEARHDVHAVEVMLFGAERLRLIAERGSATLDAAHAVGRAVRGDLGLDDARREALEPLRQLRQRHADLRGRYEALWNHENEPYALDGVLKRYDSLLARYDAMVARLDEALRVLAANDRAVQEAKAAGRQAQREPLPSLAEVGLLVRELGVRSAQPEAVVAEPLDAGLSWPEWASTRVGLTVRWPEAVPVGVPVPVQALIPKGAVPEGRVPLLHRVEGAAAGATQAAVPCQVDSVEGDAVLSFVAARPAGATVERYLLYAAPAEDGRVLPAGSVTITTEEDGMLRLQNDRVSLLIGPEGGHIFEWKILAANGLDLTQPGLKDWAGFADLGGDLRRATNTLEVLCAGPVVALVRATSPEGISKDILLCAGQGWAEVILNVATGWFWNYDDAAPFAPDGPQPGAFLYSDGFQGAVGSVSAGTQAQVRRTSVFWGAKTRGDGLTHALLTPDVRTQHATGPGSGWGGCGLEWSPAASHFVTFGDIAAGNPADVLNALAGGLSLKDQPRVTLYGLETRRSAAP